MTPSVVRTPGSQTTAASASTTAIAVSVDTGRSLRRASSRYPQRRELLRKTDLAAAAAALSSGELTELGSSAAPPTARTIVHGPAPARAAAGAQSRVISRAASAATWSWPQVSAAKMRDTAPARHGFYDHDIFIHPWTKQEYPVKKHLPSPSDFRGTIII